VSKQKGKKADESIGKKQRKAAAKATRLPENPILQGQEAVSAPSIDQARSIKPASSSQTQPQPSPKQPQQELLPFDKTLLERTRTQWQFGDWSSLTKLKASEIEHHPDCAKLALLAAAGRLQTDQFTEARSFMALARDRGVDKKTCIQILVSGVHNGLGRAAALDSQQQRALQHFEQAISVSVPGSDASRLLSQARTGIQLSSLGLVERPQNDAGRARLNWLATTAPRHAGESPPLGDIQKAWQAGHWDKLAQLDNAELANRPDCAEVALYAACGHQQLDNTEGLQRCVRLAQDRGCPHGKLKRYLTAGIHNTLALSDVLTGQYESAARNFTAALTVRLEKPGPQVIKRRAHSQLRTLKAINPEQVLQTITDYLG
jgi:hypothetical protein